MSKSERNYFIIILICAALSLGWLGKLLIEVIKEKLR